MMELAGVMFLFVVGAFICRALMIALEYVKGIALMEASMRRRVREAEVMAAIDQARAYSAIRVREIESRKD